MVALVNCHKILVLSVYFFHMQGRAFLMSHYEYWCVEMCFCALLEANSIRSHLFDSIFISHDILFFRDWKERFSTLARRDLSLFLINEKPSYRCTLFSKKGIYMHRDQEIKLRWQERSKLLKMIQS